MPLACSRPRAEVGGSFNEALGASSLPGLGKEWGFRVTSSDQLQGPDLSPPFSGGGWGGAAQSVSGRALILLPLARFLADAGADKEPSSDTEEDPLPANKCKKVTSSCTPGYHCHRSQGFPFGSQRDSHCLRRRSWWGPSSRPTSASCISTARERRVSGLEVWGET